MGVLRITPDSDAESEGESAGEIAIECFSESNTLQNSVRH